MLPYNKTYETTMLGKKGTKNRISFIHLKSFADAALRCYFCPHSLGFFFWATILTSSFFHLVWFGLVWFSLKLALSLAELDPVILLLDLTDLVCPANKQPEPLKVRTRQTVWRKLLFACFLSVLFLFITNKKVGLHFEKKKHHSFRMVYAHVRSYRMKKKMKKNRSISPLTKKYKQLKGSTPFSKMSQIKWKGAERFCTATFVKMQNFCRRQKKTIFPCP